MQDVQGDAVFAPVPLAPYGVALLIFAAPGPAAGAVVQHLHFFRVHQADHVEHTAQLFHHVLELVVGIVLAGHLVKAGQAVVPLRGQDAAQQGGVDRLALLLGEHHPQDDGPPVQLPVVVAQQTAHVHLRLLRGSGADLLPNELHVFGPQKALVLAGPVHNDLASPQLGGPP